MSAIRISKALARAAKSEAQLMCRSLAAQVEHWASIGRAVEGGMSTFEIKALFARAFRAAGVAVPKQSARVFSAVGGMADGAMFYRARIREEDPMLGVIARSGAARVVKISQRELLAAKLGRQRVDYSVQREKILPWTALSRFADADIRVALREVPLEK